MDTRSLKCVRQYPYASVHAMGISTRTISFLMWHLPEAPSPAVVATQC